MFTITPPYTGELELGIALSGGRSVATRQYHTRALKVIRPHYLDDSGQVYYIVVNPGGGYVGGDSYRIDVDVAEGASVLLTDQSAAKVYRTPGNHVTQRVDFAVRGVLEYLPDPLILYRDADFRQHVSASVARGGSLFIADIITPGWAPDGTLFGYRQARLRTEVTYAGQLAVVDNLLLTPGDRDFYLGDYTHCGTAICVDAGVDEDLLAEIRALLDGNPAAVSAADCPGFVLRALGNRSEDVYGLILDVASLVRARLRGQGPVRLRQY
ncbi:urease accessory protein UreD [Corynebacterium phocae]|uniref:Urease accessory protein UreD n=1 Tax=Corynebacterium phocae TaxID=161895 RepID=A0A1L7D1M9_9CORY|nr:urease accessory protein UreD [Corynebacterium phocae]APT91973.1 urease accessory protein UreD [Corynebacterium phocae]KAA8726967.1 urease accessory protein UreD [Corynebacterium phocae]